MAKKFGASPVGSNGTNDYTRALLGGDNELLYSDDDEDITESVLSGRGGYDDDDGEPPVRGGKRQQVQYEEEDEYEEDEYEEDEELEDDEYEEEEDQVPQRGQRQQPLTKKQQQQLYGKDQVQKIIQTRIGTYTKRIERLTPYKEAFDRISELTGMNVDQLMARLNSMSDTEQAKILGMTPEQVRQARITRQQILQEQGKNQTLARQLEETKLKADKRFADYDLYKEEIEDLIAENPKLTLKQAYILVKGDIATTAAVRDTEQRMINKQVIARQKGVVKQPGAATQSGPKISKEVISAARAVGMDPVEYAQYQAIDNIDAYRAMRSKKESRGRDIVRRR